MFVKLLDLRFRTLGCSFYIYLQLFINGIESIFTFHIKSCLSNSNIRQYVTTIIIIFIYCRATDTPQTFKTYNYRHCGTSMSPKTADYFPSGGVIATLLGNCKVLCYANMNFTLFQVSANRISVFSITQQTR